MTDLQRDTRMPSVSEERTRFPANTNGIADGENNRREGIESRTNARTSFCLARGRWFKSELLSEKSNAADGERRRKQVFFRKEIHETKKNANRRDIMDVRSNFELKELFGEQ